MSPQAVELAGDCSPTGVLARVSWNALYLLLGQIVGKLASFAYVLVLARWLSLDGFGEYNLVLSFVLVADIAVDCGLTRLIVRDLARNGSLVPRYLGSLLPVKAFIALLGYVLLIALVWAAGYPDRLVMLTAIAALGLLPSSLATTFDGALQARHHMAFSSLAGIVLSLAQIGLGAGALILGANLSVLLATLAVANVVYLGVLSYLGWRRGFRFTVRCDVPFALRILRESLPYAGITILGILSARAGVLVLGWFMGSDAVGLFSAAAKFLEAGLFFPMTVGVALTPVMSQLHVESRSRLLAVYLQTSRMLLLVTLPVTLCVILFAGPVINALFPPRYAASVPLLQILFAAFPLGALQVMHSTVLSASDYQRRFVVVALGVTAVHIALNVALIPLFGLVGAAAAAFSAEGVSLLVFFWCVRRWFLPDGAFLLRAMVQPGVAGGIMVLVSLLLHKSLHLWAVVPALAMYGGTLLLLTPVGSERQGVEPPARS